MNILFLQFKDCPICIKCISRVWALFSIQHSVIVVTQIIKLIDEVQDSFGILPLMLERLSLIYYKAFRCGMARVRFRYGGLGEAWYEVRRRAAGVNHAEVTQCAAILGHYRYCTVSTSHYCVDCTVGLHIWLT